MVIKLMCIKEDATTSLFTKGELYEVKHYVFNKDSRKTRGMMAIITNLKGGLVKQRPFKLTMVGGDKVVSSGGYLFAISSVAEVSSE